MNRTWTDEQEQYLVAHYATTSNAELGLNPLVIRERFTIESISWA